MKSQLHWRLAKCLDHSPGSSSVVPMSAAVTVRFSPPPGGLKLLQWEKGLQQVREVRGRGEEDV